MLSRIRSGLLAPHVALVEAGVPVRSIPLADVLDRTGVRAALAYLRLATSPASLDPDDLSEVYRRPSRGLPNWITKWFRHGLDVQGLQAIATRLDDAKVADKVDRLADDVARVDRGGALAAPPGRCSRRCATASASARRWRCSTAPRAARGAASSTTSTRSSRWPTCTPTPPASSRGSAACCAATSRDEGVTLSTVHRVKGREWDRVAVVGVTAGVMPHRLAESVEGERRVLHVAITRARHRALLLGDDGPALAVPRRARRHRPPPAAGRRTRPRGAARRPDEEEGRAARRAHRGRPGGGLRRPRRVAEGHRGEDREAGLRGAVERHARRDRGQAARRPWSSCRAISGIGPAKLDLYGEELLELLEGLAERT